MAKTDENRDREGGYAVRVGVGGRAIYLHREILGIARDDKGTVVEFLNGDKLDCRRENLRVVERHA